MKKIFMTNNDNEDFINATQCYVCGGVFDENDINLKK